ncbi:TROVE domain-containing protein [Winogradskya consettensis]|uniref:RNA-binding protein n=1 Tax=Winogradskya consettensis TaxID=113560 RepID=A0A919VY09_9ACTN|nr:TROVE domain-containing protein [Actinoplanes consettensis]GIM79030.1 RNA-binding protein [Actinoplanes consettensis]
MAKFNTTTAKPAVTGPITSAGPAVTYEGAAGVARDARSELFLFAVANMVGEATFYEAAGDRDARYAQLVRQVAIADPEWIAGFLTWLRSRANMRTASLVGAAEATRALLTAGKPGGRQLIASVLLRADEPGEMLAYWTGKYGRAIPKPVKRGIVDAVQRLYTEFSLLKYDTAAHGFRFADVIDLTHPTAAADSPWQGDLFKVALDRRHKRDTALPASLPMLARNAELRARVAGNSSALLDADALKAAGMTWEDALSLAGAQVDKAAMWSALIPSMGYAALLRNLRNFDQAQVPDDVATAVAERLSDADQVRRSRQFPFRFLAAYRAAPSLRWGHALDKALNLSLSNVPKLPGRTLVLVDRSGSMFDTMSARSELTRADAAAVFGAALAARNPGQVDLVQFGTRSHSVDVRPGESLLRVIDRFSNLGGTKTRTALHKWYAGHDRVLIVTDEQAWAGDGDPGSAIPPHTPLYTWNLAGYQAGHGATGPYRHTFGGLTDAAFRMVPLLESGRNGTWPWE